MITGKPVGCHISLLLAGGAPLSSVAGLALQSPELSFIFRCFYSVTQAPFYKMSDSTSLCSRQHAGIQCSPWHKINAKEHGDLYSRVRRLLDPETSKRFDYLPSCNYSKT